MTNRIPRGQSLVEAMVAISIIISSVSSSLALVQSSITSTTNGGTQVAAANLAREGIEVVRALRDTNWLKSQSFQTGLVDAGGSKIARPILNPGDGTWSASFVATSISAPNATVYVTPDGVYFQTDGTPPTGSLPSAYTRILSLQHLCRDNATGAERAVSGSGSCLGSETFAGLLTGSTVRWRGVGGRFQTLTLEERLYDWR